VAGNPGHSSSQGAAFYAKDFTRDISVRTVSGHCHGTEHRFSYAKPGDTKHNYKPKSGYNQYAAGNNVNPDWNHFHDGLRLNGYITNVPARKHDY
jgi:hypothetical protein